MNLKKLAFEYSKKKLLRERGIKAILLTGSVSRDTGDEKSDIDLVFFYRKLEGDQRDNMHWDEIKGVKVQIAETTLPIVLDDIQKKNAFRISQISDAIVIHDPEGYLDTIKRKLKNFTFGVNLRTRLEVAEDGLNDAKRALEKKDTTMAKLLIDLYGFWTVRDFLLYKNDPYAHAAKTILSELEKTDANISKKYRRLIDEEDVTKKIMLFRELIKTLSRKR